MSIRKLRIDKAAFLIWKPAIFCKVKELKPLSGGVVFYAAQSKEQSDAEIVKKGGSEQKLTKDEHGEKIECPRARS